MRTHLIGFCGYAQVGKDTAGKVLVDSFGYQRVAFADPVKEYLYELNPAILGMTMQYLVDSCGWDEAKIYRQVRDLLVGVGKTSRKIHGHDCWLNIANQTWHGYLDCDHRGQPGPDHQPVVVTDVRYKNEAECIKEYGGKVIRITRPDHGPANDEEKSVDEIVPDFTVANGGSAAEFQSKIHDIFRLLEKSSEKPGNQITETL